MKRRVKYTVERNPEDGMIHVISTYDDRTTIERAYKYKTNDDIREMVNSQGTVCIDNCYIKDFCYSQIVKDIGNKVLKYFSAEGAFFDSSEGKYVDFSDAIFGTGSVHFNSSTFGDSNVRFVRANFGAGNVDFTNTYFGNGHKDFRNVSFGDGDVDFNMANFCNGDVSFRDTIFGNGNVGFQNVNFGNGNVDFWKASFGDGDVDFSGALWGIGNTNFKQVSIGKGNMKFVSAYFGDGDIDFRRMTVKNGDVQFNASVFGRGNIDFGEATFEKGKLSFVGTIFGDGNVNFISTTFDECDVSLIEGVMDSCTVDFTAARSNGIVILRGCTFPSTLDLHFDKVGGLIMDNIHLAGITRLRPIRCGGLVMRDVINTGVMDSDWDQIKTSIVEWDNDEKKLITSRILSALKLEMSEVRESEAKKEEIEKKVSKIKCDGILLLKGSYQSQGKYDDEDCAYIAYKRQARKMRSIFTRVGSKLVDLTCGYGTQPLKVIITMLTVILSCAFLYSMSNGITTMQAQSDGISFATGLYFSLITFLTIGYGDIHPCTQFSACLAGIEGFLGVLLMSLFSVAIVRKILR